MNNLQFNASYLWVYTLNDCGEFNHSRDSCYQDWYFWDISYFLGIVFVELFTKEVKVMKK